MKKTGSRVSFNNFIPFAALPATFFGVYTMIYFDAPTNIWLLNLTFVFLGTFIALLFSRNPIRLNNINPITVLIVSIILLLGTFYDDGIMHVHRWIKFNSLQMNIGLIVSPLILIQISRIPNHIIAITFSIITIIIFILQPDASLVSAFSIAIYVLLFRKHKSKLISTSFSLFLLLMIGYSWYNLDSLEAVRFVENITNLTKEISMTLFFASMISLLVLIIPFIHYYSIKDKLSISLGIYFLVLLLTTFVGHFPVMIMGYGISPIIGYFIGLIWQINTNSNKTRKEKILLKQT
ncbi:hypothetical protein J2X69_002084 [Algoriphagus sp. 4150]|uniref:hypothetical protein n=1 Tax=Algoriphagus sp. 4150 TaxID=2817756 RepID=UPI002859BD9A|nr:hypothetical protein [Algoriphagus sp. 4150]MDR7129739.1 hypothetical protein [Algoriphagus sp. 4150]